MRIEYAHERKTRERNKVIYRFAHWPIWIWVFFLAPGPLTFDLFAHGPGWNNGLWLIVVVVATGVAGWFGLLPGVEPQPYILRFCEDKLNPLYRRICYTFAWNALLSFAILNLVGMIVAVSTRKWLLKQIYAYGYLPAFLVVIGLGICGMLPRVKHSTKGEGVERRYFYGAVWSVSLGQAVLLVLWKTLPPSHAADVSKLIAFVLVVAVIAAAASRALLPRTRPILPGELMMAD